MTRLRLALIAALTGAALCAVTVPAAVASNGTSAASKLSSLPALYTTHVTGTGKNGKPFNGTHAIQRFVAGANKVSAVGTLTGTLKGRHVTRYGVMLPAALNGGTGLLGSARAAQASCPILHLVLGPINLNLRGLVVTTNQININITAVPGAGNLLGNLLCGLTNALNGTGLSTLTSNLQQLAATLNSLTSLLGAL